MKILLRKQDCKISERSGDIWEIDIGTPVYFEDESRAYLLHESDMTESIPFPTISLAPKEIKL